MAIKGLTDRAQNYQLDLGPRGRPVVLGRLQKGEREGFGKKIKLYDRDWLVFVPYGDRAEELSALFVEAYGEKPTAVSDARIPITLAGNFKIEDCAWLIASKHTENGSTFMARSDGEWIRQARDPKTGHVRFYKEGELAHKDATRDAGRDKPGYIYGSKTYPWQQVMQIDLVLPGFNRLVYEAGVAGAGVVTLTTHSTYDIASLISEYYAILDAVTGLFTRPGRADYERAKNIIPLRNIPLRLYRSEDPVSTPNWKKGADPGERLRSTRSLLHWQLAPEFSAAMQEALDKRTQQTLAAVANLPLLEAGQRTVQQITQEANDELFGPEPPALAAPEPEPPTYAGTPPWDEVAEGEFTEEDDDGDRVEILPGDTVVGQRDPDAPEDDDTCPVHGFDLPCPECSFIARTESGKEPATPEEAAAELDKALGREPKETADDDEEDDESDSRADILSAETMDSWVVNAYNVDDIASAFASPAKLEKWVEHVTRGNYHPEINEDLLEGALYFATEVQGGAKRMDAANEIRDALDVDIDA